MTNLQQRSLSRTCVILIASITVVACSDSGTGSGEPVEGSDEVLTAQHSREWQLAAETANTAMLDRGQRAFQMCTGCHGIDQGEMSPAGPSLAGIAGRRVGTLDSYPYTQALTDKTESWTVKRFDDFIASPQDVYPGNGMAYTGLKNDEDRTALIAYVATKSLKQ